MNTDKATNVLHLVEYFYLGGIEKLLEIFAAHQSDINCKFYFYTYMTDFLDGLGLRVSERYGRVFYQHKSAGYDYTLLVKLAKFIKTHKIEVIHTHDFGPMEYAVALKFIFPGIRLIHTQHSLRGFIDKKKYLLFFEVVSFFYKKVHFVSDSLSCSVSRLLLFPWKSNYKVLPNGIDTDFRRKGPFSRRYKSVLKLLVVSRLSEEKNINIVINAVEQARKIGVMVKCSIAGDGPLLGLLKSGIEERGLTDCIEFKGFMFDLSQEYLNTDVFISASCTEGHPIAVLEAMAHQCLCLLSDIPGHRFAKKDVCIYFDLERLNLVDKIIGIANSSQDDVLFRNMRRNARDMVSENYNVNLMMKRYKDSYLF